jgi:hypothetical protein
LAQAALEQKRQVLLPAIPFTLSISDCKVYLALKFITSAIFCFETLYSSVNRQFWHETKVNLLLWNSNILVHMLPIVHISPISYSLLPHFGQVYLNT